MWHSNAPWAPTGYGQQTAMFTPLIAEQYDLAISSFYGLEGAPLTWHGLPVLPGIGGAFGEQFLLDHCEKRWGDPRGGLVITLLDVWVLDTAIMEQLNTAAWVPIDHDPAPPQVVEYFTKTDAVPIAMSRFGEKRLGRLDPLYVPHGVDTSVYKPRNRNVAREQGGIPKDAFLVGMVAANKGRPSRKAFSQALQAFRQLLDKRENSYLYLHTQLNPNFAGGEDLPALLDVLEIPEDHVRKADQYAMGFNPYPPEAMAQLYSAMDVLLSPSMGEGFGIPILEAQACGTPVIVQDFSAMTELCGAGWTTKPATKHWTSLRSWQSIPDVDDIVDALLDCAARKAFDRERISMRAREFALDYDVHKVFEQYWVPALRQVEQRFANRDPFTIAPRARVTA
jgi:glycosyltransferase involved in cell wall biosynthesis